MIDSDDERLTLEVRRLLSDVLRQADFPGSEELMNQVSSVRVTGGPISMLELRSDPNLRPSVFTEGPIPLSLFVLSSVGASVGELLVWVEKGFLAGLEFAWWSDDSPYELPSSDHIKVKRK